MGMHHEIRLDDIASGKIVAKGFPPIIGDTPRVLILGSMPSLESLRTNRYYGNPRNHFWPLIFAIYGEVLPDSYDSRTAFLREHHIALWDVLASCRRKGSLDSAIREEAYNDLLGLLFSCPTITSVCFNGRKAETSWLRYSKLKGVAAERLRPLHYLVLPSSSPIPTGLMKSMEDKLPRWSQLRLLSSSAP